jgi:predicted RNase H-like HicB family nuclease
MIRVTFDLPAETRQEGNWWVASCPPLDVHSQGPSRDQARINLSDALGFFFESCVERGTLFEVLHEAGFTPAPGRDPGIEGETVSVPLPFMLPGVAVTDRDNHKLS